MATHTTLASLFDAIADAIRGRKGTTASIVADNFPTEINSITTLSGGSNDATATASDVLSGKTCYVKGSKITGNIPTKTSSNLTVSGATVSVPAGYYASTASKSVATDTLSTDDITISVDANGKITAKTSVISGYITSTGVAKTHQLTTQAAKTITPTTSNQTAVASGRYTTGAITVKGDSNLIASNIKSGVSIFGVTGTYTGSSSGSSTTQIAILYIQSPSGMLYGVLEYIFNSGETWSEFISRINSQSLQIYNGYVECFFNERFYTVLDDGQAVQGTDLIKTNVFYDVMIQDL